MAYNADKKPLELSALVTLASDDTLIVGDTSDTSEVVKSITKANFQAGLSITESQISDLGSYITGASPTITTPTLTLKQSTTPTPTAEGDIQWDTDNDRIVVGDGAGQKVFSDDAAIAVAYQPLDSDLTTIAAANNGSVLAATTASFTTADETKLDGIEAGADATDTANVTAAGALMDSEVTNLAAVKAFDPTDYVAVTGDTMSGDLAMGDQDITGVGAVRFTQQLDNGSKTASFSVDFATDQHQKVTLTANTMTLTLDTTSIGVGVYTLEIVNGGLATLTWASETGSITWAGGVAPTLTSSGTDVVSLLWTGSVWRGQASLAFA